MKKKRTPWDREIRANRNPPEIYAGGWPRLGVSNWNVGTDPFWKSWVQFEVLIATVQVRWRIVALVWTVLVFIAGFVVGNLV